MVDLTHLTWRFLLNIGACLTAYALLQNLRLSDLTQRLLLIACGIAIGCVIVFGNVSSFPFSGVIPWPLPPDDVQFDWPTKIALGSIPVGICVLMALMMPSRRYDEE